jgi:hypothetical protein
VKIHPHPGSALHAAITGVKTKKIIAIVTGTAITGVLDVKTGSL